MQIVKGSLVNRSNLGWSSSGETSISSYDILSEVPPQVQLSVQYWSTGDNFSIGTCSNRNNGKPALTRSPLLSRRWERQKRRGNYSRHSLPSPHGSADKRSQIIAMKKKTDRIVSLGFFLCMHCQFQKLIETMQIFQKLQSSLKKIYYPLRVLTLKVLLTMF